MVTYTKVMKLLEFCPQCKQPRSKFKEVVESDELDFVTEHHIGDGVVEDAEVMEGLKAHFMGECTEVGMYLAMSRQADREGYPEVAEAFKRYAWEEAEHASKFAELLGEIVWNTEKNLKARMEAEKWSLCRQNAYCKTCQRTWL